MSAEFDRRKFVTPSVHRPWLAWGSAEMSLADKAEYDTRVRVTSPYDRLATAIVKLFVHYDVRTIKIQLGLLHLGFDYIYRV